MTSEEAKVGEELPSEDMNEKSQSNIDPCRVHVSNLPKFYGFKDFKKLLQKHFADLNPKRVRQLRECAYLTLDTPEDAQNVIKVLDGLEVKKTQLKAKLAVSEEKRVMSTADIAKDQTEGTAEFKLKTAKEVVSPLADIPYEEQINSKNSACGKLLKKLQQQMESVRITKAADNVLKPIIPSPKIVEYRNKCEFTVGLSIDLKPCVGFKGGKYLQQQNYVVPIEDVSIITKQTKSIVKTFKQFIVDSGLEPFDEVSRKGFWKLLTVREFGADVMIIVTVVPLECKETEEKIKKSLCEKFLANSSFSEFGFRVTSIYWSGQAHLSDNASYEHLGGTPYIYESLLDCRFRVSPSAFFQTNSVAASVLYSVIGDACCLSENGESRKEDANDQSTEPPETKRSKIDEDQQVSAKDNAVSNSSSKKVSTVLLDICCGTGTIGLFLMKKHRQTHNMHLLGFEYVESAVQDAIQNAKDNGIPDNSYRFIAGEAEDRIKNIKYYMPPGVSLDNVNVIGVLDPPRAGIHNTVIIRCREMEKMRRLVYVSCDPNAAMKNIVDLCRPMSKKFGGVPFTVESIQPVDMFPQTSHFEWVVTLSR